MRRSFGSKRPVEQVPGKANFQKPTPASVIKGGSSNIGHLEIFFSKFKTFLQEVLEFGEENIQDTSMLVLRKTHQKKESSTYVKISSRNFDICQRFPEYGEKKEKSCHILHKVNSIIGHLEIFFSKFKTFLQEVLEFGEENFQDR